MKQLNLTDEEFWNPLGYQFWLGLNWTKEGKELLTGLESLFGESIVLLTSPCNTPGSVEGKVDWVKKHLSNYSRRLFVGPAKHLLAAPSKILLDDCDGNVETFRLHTGQAILVPRPWNEKSEETNAQGEFDISSLIKKVEALLVN